MSTKSRILIVGRPQSGDESLAERLGESHEIVWEPDSIDVMARLASEPFEGVYFRGADAEAALSVGRLLESQRILEQMPDGVVLLDTENTILWGNGRLREWSGSDSVVGGNFFATLGNPEILGPDFCPFHTALATRKASSSVLRMDENRYLHAHVAPVCEGDESPRRLIVTVRDVTREMLQQQKMAAIHQAGVELADLSPEELSSMTVEQRIELLKSNILHFTQDLLNFDVVEIRMLEAGTGELTSLLAVGIEPEAASRKLYAKPQGNGVTGFVAATGKSYLCEDTAQDPLYLEGAKGAKSSLTVPLVLHDEVIGTFNVESPEPRAFSENDLQFLEIFSRDVAVALNTLELLVVEKATTAAESVDAIHSAVALPVDDILNDAVNVMERYIGHQPEVVERLQRILRNARDIKQVIQSVGRQMAPLQAAPNVPEAQRRPLLYGRQILVADADESVRGAAHALLERFGCIVETAHDGGEAVFMVRNLSEGAAYNAILADIRLPDMTGYELMVKLNEVLPSVPLILMTGFGYDPGHSVVKARQAGLKQVLYKPFRLDQLLESVESVVSSHGVVQPS